MRKKILEIVESIFGESDDVELVSEEPEGDVDTTQAFEVSAEDAAMRLVYCKRCLAVHKWSVCKHPIRH